MQFSGIFESGVLEAAHRFRRQLEAALSMAGITDGNLLGPAPAAVAKINNNYRYRLTLLCSNSRTLRLLFGQQLQLFLKDKANKGISAWIDTNSYE